jgi:hypothetical protein
VALVQTVLPAACAVTALALARFGPGPDIADPALGQPPITLTDTIFTKPVTPYAVVAAGAAGEAGGRRRAVTAQDALRQAYAAEAAFVDIAPQTDMLNYLLDEQRENNIFFLQTHLGAFSAVPQAGGGVNNTVWVSGESPHALGVYMAKHTEVWHGMAWPRTAWHGMAPHGMAWHGMAPHGMAPHGMAWHGSRHHTHP